MRIRTYNYDPKREPQRTTGGLLIYNGILIAGLLAMAYPVVTVIGITVIGLLLWKVRRGDWTPTAGSSGRRRRSEHTTSRRKYNPPSRGD